ncbi:MAG: alpha/beta fold hydrolase [Calditrichota bacterium]
MEEQFVEFKNEVGNTLRGILHHGLTDDYKNVCLIFLNTGLNDMVGWHRLQLKIARHFALEGYNVLRFDNFGIGDSDGEIEEGEVSGIMTQIERGLWANDAISALEFMIDRFENEKFYYMGYCGGALNAIHAAAKEKRVHGIINVAAPIALSAKIEQEQLNPYHAQKSVESYKAKIVKIRSIFNFLMGKSDYKLIFKSLFFYFKHKFSGFYDSHDSLPNLSDSKINLNKSLFASFEKFMKSNRPILFYYPEFDNSTWELKNYFMPRYRETEFWKKYCSFIELEGANHIFAEDESQRRIKTDVLDWLQKIETKENISKISSNN